MVPQTKGPDGNNLICVDGPMAAPTQHLGEYSSFCIFVFFCFCVVLNFMTHKHKQTSNKIKGYYCWSWNWGIFTIFVI